MGKEQKSLWTTFLFKHRENESTPPPKEDDYKVEQVLPATLLSSKEMLENSLGKPDDLFFRFVEPPALKRKFMICAIEGLIDQKELSLHVVEPLQVSREKLDESEDILEALGEKIISVSNYKKIDTIDEAKNQLLDGNSLLFAEGLSSALVIFNHEYEHRTVNEPITEQVIRGPIEGFVESLQVNRALLRKHIKDERLRLDGMRLGRRSRSNVVVAYIDGIANKPRVDAVKEDLASLDIDIVHDVAELSILLQKRSANIFPLSMTSERTDKVTAALMEGRIAVFLENSPAAMVVPALFIDFWRTPEDYYSSPVIATFYRFIRMIFGNHLTMMLPALYVAFTSFPTGIIGSQLIMNMASSREGIAFPPVIEVLIMLILLDIILEASQRLPRLVGGATTIVGGLILGQAAVQAKLASNIMVIVVAVTAITNLTVSNLAMLPAMRLLKYYFVLWASFFGVAGIVFAATTVLAYVGSLKSYGIPYLSQMSAIHLRDIFDTIYVLSPKMRTHRPRTLKTIDGQRWDSKTMKYNEDSLDDV
ncbi:spore germination protein [Heliorestis convoluta]|uniref:Spore germination protein GerKA n=1 Tax=Heliorestis convoluta TaxID=356322 RepID=A0A5Q2MYP4_9FIRM|nr:spore germination protein [Heliorestis convoluta]QGG46276.1 Spore germination protein GerKA [Heliorestis convoluta]